MHHPLAKAKMKQKQMDVVWVQIGRREVYREMIKRMTHSVTIAHFKLTIYEVCIINFILQMSKSEL